MSNYMFYHGKLRYDQPILMPNDWKTHMLSRPMTQKIRLHDGQQMPVLVIGRGQPVIMLHGFGMDAALWLPFVAPFTRQYQFYLPYLRGFGKASRVKPSQPDFIEDYVLDIAAMRQQLGLDQVILAGVSMGALLSLKLHAAGQFAGVLRYLHIDQSPVVPHKPDWSHGVFGERQTQTFTQFQGLIARAQPYLHLSHTQIPSEFKHDLLQSLADFVNETVHSHTQRRLLKPLSRFPQLMQYAMPMQGWSTLIHGMQAYIEQGYDLRQSLSELHVPVTVFSGARSRLYAVEGQTRFTEMLPNGRQVIFAQSGHMPMLDQPLMFVREFGRFLRG